MTEPNGGEAVRSPRALNPPTIVWLTWFVLTIVAGAIYVGVNVQDTSTELYAQSWTFQVLAFFYTHGIFLLSGIAGSLAAANTAPLQRSVWWCIGTSTVVFVVCEIVVIGVWGR